MPSQATAPFLSDCANVGVFTSREDRFSLAGERLGPWPAASLEVLADLGMTDSEIGRYVGLPVFTIRRLRIRYGISGHPR